MKVRNLQDYPQQLADGRVVGASGTHHATRDYDLPELDKDDKKRVKRGWLEVVEEEEKPTVKAETESENKTPAPPSGSNNLKGGSK